MVVVSSTKGAKADQVTAIMMLANADFLLQMAAQQQGGGMGRGGGGMNAGMGGGMMGGYGMWAGGLIWLLVLIVLILGAAALVKYLRS